MQLHGQAEDELPRGPSAVSGAQEGAPPGARQKKYVNLVLQGGGTLGLAHVGAIAALEEMDYRFVGLAGTSAGAIAALLIAAARSHVDDPVAPFIQSMLESLPADEFVDGPPSVRALVRRLAPVRALTLRDALLIPSAVRALRVVLTKGGLNAGYTFEHWLAGVLRNRCDIETIKHLEDRVAKALAPLRGTSGLEDHLALMATALPLGIKMVFPRDLHALRADWDVRGPALMVRASMAVPLFFEPVRLSVHSERWRDYVRQRVRSQRSALELDDVEDLRYVGLVDGGLLSNFPVDAFSPGSVRPDAACAELPTIGISLCRREQARDWGPATPSSVVASVAAMISATRLLRDREARERAERRGLRLIFVDTAEHNWLNFALSADDQRDLVRRGRQAVVDQIGYAGHDKA